MEFVIAGATAALLTLFDLDRTFYIPTSTPSRVALWSWWWGFVVANGALAAGLYGLLGGAEGLKQLSPELGAFAIGIGYLALIRLKFTTFNFHDNEVPFGIEAFYEAARSYAYKRINRIARDARYAETMALASSTSLADLASRARLSIEQDMLIDFEEKRHRKAWLVRVEKDTSLSELDKKLTIADFILSGLRSSEVT